MVEKRLSFSSNIIERSSNNLLLYLFSGWTIIQLDYVPLTVTLNGIAGYFLLVYCLWLVLFVYPSFSTGLPMGRTFNPFIAFFVYDLRATYNVIRFCSRRHFYVCLKPMSL